MTCMRAEMGRFLLYFQNGKSWFSWRYKTLFIGVFGIGGFVLFTSRMATHTASVSPFFKGMVHSSLRPSSGGLSELKKRKY